MKKTFNAKFLSKISFTLNYNQYKYINTKIGTAFGQFSYSCNDEKNI